MRFTSKLLTQAEKSSRAQTLKWLDGLLEMTGAAFQKLLDVLEEKNHCWLKDEMLVDLMAEKGELVVEDYIQKQAGLIIRRHWGKAGII